MGQPLRVLIVEDSENDAILLVRSLQRAGYDPQYLQVWTSAALNAALDEQDWDIVLSDYVMPGFSGLKALEIVHEKDPDIPFIVVSGQIGEDVAVTAMKAGAQDYIMKGNLKRLIPAVERELADAVVRKQARDADHLLHQTSERLKLVTDTIQDVFWIVSPGGKEIIYLSPAFDSLWGFPREEAYASTWKMKDAIHPADQDRRSEIMRKHGKGQQYEEEYRIVRPDGSVRWVRDRGYPVRNKSGRLINMTGVTTDITELKAVNRALITLTRCNEALVRSSTEEELLQAVCNILTEAGAYRMSWVGYLQGKGRQVTPICSAGSEEGYLSAIRIDLSDKKESRGPVGNAVRALRPSVVQDIVSDASFSPWRNEAVKRGYGSSVALPLVERGQAFGALCIYAAERDAFNEEEVALLAQLADDLCYGIRAIRVRAERDHAEAELRALANRLVQSQEDERRTIARELHDQTGQQLTFLKLLLERVRRSIAKGEPTELEEAQKVASEIIAQVRSLSLSLRPGMLDDLGLLPALQWSLQDFTAKTKIAVDFKHQGLDRRFSQQVGTAVYRIIQEALTNVVRYANVGRVAVTVRASDKDLTVRIKDEGIGFDPATVPLTSSGIRGSRERALSLGGTLAVKSAPGRGAEVTVVLPLDQEPEAQPLLR